MSDCWGVKLCMASKLDTEECTTIAFVELSSELSRSHQWLISDCPKHIQLSLIYFRTRIQLLEVCRRRVCGKSELQILRPILQTKKCSFRWQVWQRLSCDLGNWPESFVPYSTHSQFATQINITGCMVESRQAQRQDLQPSFEGPQTVYPSSVGLPSLYDRAFIWKSRGSRRAPLIPAFPSKQRWPLLSLHSKPQLRLCSCCLLSQSQILCPGLLHCCRQHRQLLPQAWACRAKVCSPRLDSVLKLHWQSLQNT